jgi:DNA modification methylase
LLRESVDPPRVAYRTSLGRMIHGRAEVALRLRRSALREKVQLVFTSPPFPLKTKKRYGNATGEDYLEWLADFAKSLPPLLTRTGSIVVEMGNAWEPGRPVMSTFGLRALLKFQESASLRLCQEFICHNPARLPTPAQWVSIERIRVKDSFTRLWWLSATDRPKANNRNVLTAYSDAMRSLLATRKYSAGKRPSQHHVRPTTFLKDNGGSIPGSVLTHSNTQSSDAYLKYCRANGLPLHPARMPRALAEFFIRFLTDEGDLVLDPFAGSNTTGSVAQTLNRNWLSIEARNEYVEGSRAWFPRPRK